MSKVSVLAALGLLIGAAPQDAKSIKDVAGKKAGGLDALKKAGDCRGCHSIHRPAK